MPYGMHDGGWGLGDRRRERSPDPRQILEERFARGEIAEEEYRERKRVLDERRP